MKFEKKYFQIIRTYFPFEQYQNGNITQWGVYKTYELKDFDYNNNEMFTKLRNLNEFPLRVSLFRRYPTSLQGHELPKVFRSSYLMRDSWRSDGYGGMDGIMLANVAKTLNFTAIVVTPIGIDFGYKASNGTFLGKISIFFNFYKSRQ